MLKNSVSQKGQTLIETLVACFVLVMGISAALGLANYSLGATNSIKQQTIGLGLAREGIEVIKNMRDTNWLKATYNTDCYNFSTGGNTAICYKNWLNSSGVGGYDIPVGTYSIRFNSGSTLPWTAVNTATDFGLNTSSGTGVLYNGANGVTALTANSGYARKITISQDTFAPFDRAGDTGPRIKVSSQVWWTGKGCPASVNPPTDKNCTVTLETYLTNWRVF